MDNLKVHTKKPQEKLEGLKAQEKGGVCVCVGGGGVDV